MVSDYIVRKPSLYTGDPIMPPITVQDDIIKPAVDIVYFDGLSLLSVFQVSRSFINQNAKKNENTLFQVLCALVTITCGVLRLLWRAKYAIGIEILFSVLVLIAGIMGIYANNKR